MKALRSVMRIRPFRRLWIVLGVASLGDWLGLLATAIFASAQVTGSAAKGLVFGSTIAVRLLPALVLGPVAARLQQTEVRDHDAGARRVRTADGDVALTANGRPVGPDA